MTAGFGWIGEINNQFNINKFPAKANYFGVLQEDIFPASPLMASIQPPISAQAVRTLDPSTASWASRS